jgi:hypothetical protein
MGVEIFPLGNGFSPSFRSFFFSVNTWDTMRKLPCSNAFSGLQW